MNWECQGQLNFRKIQSEDKLFEFLNTHIYTSNFPFNIKTNETNICFISNKTLGRITKKNTMARELCHCVFAISHYHCRVPDKEWSFQDGGL
jgi:hypothetical protein